MNNQILEMIALILSMIGQPNLDIKVTMSADILANGAVAAHVIYKNQDPTGPHNMVINPNEWNNLPERVKLATLVHEIAHVVTVDRGHDIYKNAKHKKDFRKVCRELVSMVELPVGQSNVACKASFDAFTL